MLALSVKEFLLDNTVVCANCWSEHSDYSSGRAHGGVKKQLHVQHLTNTTRCQSGQMKRQLVQDGDASAPDCPLDTDADNKTYRNLHHSVQCSGETQALSRDVAVTPAMFTRYLQRRDLFVLCKACRRMEHPHMMAGVTAAIDPVQQEERLQRRLDNEPPSWRQER